MLQYRFPNGTRLEIDQGAFNTHHSIVRAYRGKKEFSLPVWLIDGLQKALAYGRKGQLCLRYAALPNAVRTTLPTRIHTEDGQRINVSAM